jgi:GT2 family glycosyltransferase
MDTATTLLSVVVVTYNSRDDLEGCLASLANEATEAEIILVDNCSTDDTVRWVRATYSDIQVIALDHNAWYAGGNNRGLREARGEYILVLNPDTVVRPGALDELVRVGEACPRAFITAKLILPDGRVNACGNHMHYAGITTCAGLGSDADAFHGITRPLLLSGAAILARRAAWDDVTGFDESFAMYMEDADLSLRARLKGYEVVCAADAEIIHHYRLGMSPDKFFFLERNRLLTLLKVYETQTLLRIVPGLVITEAATAAFGLLRGRAYLRAWWQSYMWLWQQRHHWREQRRRVQHGRRVGDRALFREMGTVLPFDQLMDNQQVARLLQHVTAPIYRAVKPYRSMR